MTGARQWEETKAEVKDKPAFDVKFLSPRELEAFHASRKASKTLIRAILHGPQSGRRVNSIAKAQGKRDKWGGGVSNVGR